MLGTRERSRQGPLAESLSKRKRTRSLVSLGICVWGSPFPEVGGYGQEGQLGPRSRPVTLFSSSLGGQMLDSALPSVFKGSEVQRWQIFLFRSKESSLSATVVNDLVSCQP